MKTSSSFYSQIGQDRWVATIFSSKKRGYFVDVGAHDGTTFSNTAYLERELGWNGICIEPTPEVFLKLTTSRSCTCLNKAVSDYCGTADFILRSDRDGLLNRILLPHSKAPLKNAVLMKTECVTLGEILLNEAPQQIDYLSLDVEGGEFLVLKGIDFSKVQIGLITVEHNHEIPKRDQILHLLRSKGYIRVRKIAFEDWYMSTVVFSRSRAFQEFLRWEAKRIVRGIARRLKAISVHSLSTRLIERFSSKEIKID